MKKDYLLGILFFGSLWGASEAILGGFLYSNQMPFASVVLTVIAFIVLTIARVYFPKNGFSTLIAFIAMLYKFLNTPFYACHLLSIFLLGLSYDLVFSLIKIKSKAILALISTYLGHILFALLVTYIVQYRYWANVGLPKVLSYIGLNGTFSAIVNLIVVPMSFTFGVRFREKNINPFEFKSKLVSACVSFITLALWIIGLIR